MQNDYLIGRIVHGNLMIKVLIGEGGMGQVYLASNAEVQEKRYAVKVLRREFTHDARFRQHFYDEARHQAQLDHANIVQMIDYFHIDDDYFLVLEYVDGQSLSEMIDSKGKNGLPEKQALSIVKGMLAGLDAAHRLAILHRDVKSSNVLVDRSGRARLTDFGIAMQAGGLTTLQGVNVMGTPAYMSPEQLRNSAEIDHRSDVYSAGAVLFEALTGRLPFAGESFEAVAAEQMAHPAPDPRHFNPKIRRGVAEAVRRALRTDPAERFQGCAAFLKALEKLDSDKWKYALLSACVMAALSIYLVKALVIDRQAIHNVLISATHAYNMLCREQAAREFHERQRSIASEDGFSDLVADFSKHISDNNRNMATFASDYGQALHRLTDFNQLAVRQVLDAPEPDPNARQTKPQMRADYQQYRENGQTPTSQSMRGNCTGIGFDTSGQ
jgi:serine/threonine protein kinase